MRKLLLALLLAVMPVWADERDDIITLLEKHAPSVGALYAHESQGDMKFLCSVTAIGRHEGNTVILTAHHCLNKGVAYLVNFGDGILRAATPWKVPHYELPDSQRKYGEPKTDMALFLMRGDDVPIADIGESKGMKSGQKLVMVGYPLGVSKITYEGILAGRFDRPGADNDGYLLLQIFGAPGSSGSAVVDAATQKIVGVLVAARQSRVGLPVIFGTPIEYQEHLAVVTEDDDEEGSDTRAPAGSVEP